MLPTHDRWIEAARITYNLGIVVLFAALAIALVPDDDPNFWRCAAIVLPAIGAVGELAWSIGGEVNLRVKRRKSRESTAGRPRSPAPLAQPRVTPLPGEPSSDQTTEPPPEG